MRIKSSFYPAGRSFFEALAPEIGPHAIAATAREWVRCGLVLRDAAGRHYIVDPQTRTVTPIERITHV